jgi:energy-coupling factor transporter ATP-binding protein EcfA2
MTDRAKDMHLLRQLELPARYEALATRVGPEVAQLLVDPGEATKTTLERAGLSVKGRHEGTLLPLVGASGTGKTTLARNLSAFLPSEYTTTVVHDGAVSFDALRSAAKRDAPVRNDDRVIPINIDHREAIPPTPEELAEIKRFIRDSEIGSRCVLLWPQVSTEQADAMGRSYIEVAGRAPVDLPIVVEGPSRDTWVQIALSTLSLSNQMIGSLELLGVDPRVYDPEGYDTIGEFLRQIADDFTDYLQKLLGEMRTPVKLVIIVASESANPGVLSQMTSSTRYGFLDASGLLAATPNSRLGEWWGSRRGALTQTIVRLDAHAMCLSPTSSIPALSRFGDKEVQDALEDMGIERPGPADVNQALKRSDLGQLLIGVDRSMYEARGTPSTQATPAFQLLAERGFNLGNDKDFNKSLCEAIGVFLAAEGIDCNAVTPESGLAGTALIPDNAVEFADETMCIEYTWRKGEFLSSANRSTVAQYVLDKLKNYAVALRWVDG